MPKQTFTAATTGGVWTTVVTGEGTAVSLVANATSKDTLVALRLKLANGSASYILPMNSLPFNIPNRMAIAGISLQAGDKLEAMSTDPAIWIASLMTGTAYKSVVATSPSTNDWTQLIAGPCTVRGIFSSVSGAAILGVKVKKATQEAVVVAGERLAAGGSKRLMIPLVLAAGESIQVQSTGTAFWIATGVTTP